MSGLLCRTLVLVTCVLACTAGRVAAQSASPANGGAAVQRGPDDAGGDAHKRRAAGLRKRDVQESMPGIARRFDAMDRNHDGVVSRDEVRAFARERRRRHVHEREAGQGGRDLHP